MNVTPNFKQPKAVKDPKYVGYVKQLPCVICEAYGEPYGQAPSDAHHPICGRFSQAKAPDHTVIPLCKAHHQTGEHGKPSVHGHRAAFVEAYGPDTEYIDITRDRVFEEFGYTPKGFKQ